MIHSRHDTRRRIIAVEDVFGETHLTAQWFMVAAMDRRAVRVSGLQPLYIPVANKYRNAAAPVQKSNCWLSGSPAQKGRCVNPRRRCGVPELPGELNNIEESWPRSSSVFPDPFPCCSATNERSPIGAGHCFRTPLKIKRGYGRKNGAGVFS